MTDSFKNGQLATPVGEEVGREICKQEEGVGKSGHTATTTFF